LKRLFLAAAAVLVMAAVVAAAALAAVAMEYLNQFPTTPLPDCHSHPPTIPLPLVMNPLLASRTEFLLLRWPFFMPFFCSFWFFRGFLYQEPSDLLKNGNTDFRRTILFYN
jgi:hypothetical protein